MPMFRKASKLAVTKARSNPRGNGQVTQNWLLKQYRRKLTENGMTPEKVPFFKLHSPRIIGATTTFASGEVTDMHMKSKGRWSGDIAYICARFCPEMDREEVVRAMGTTHASLPHLLRNAPTHTGLRFRPGPRAMPTWETRKSATKAMNHCQTTKPKRRRIDGS